MIPEALAAWLEVAGSVGDVAAKDGADWSTGGEEAAAADPALLSEPSTNSIATTPEDEGGE